MGVPEGIWSVVQKGVAVAAASSSTTPPSSTTTTDPALPAAGEVVSATVDTIAVLLGMGAGLLVGLLAAFALQGFLTYVGRRRPIARTTIRAVSKPLKLLLSMLGIWIGMRLSWPVESGEDAPALRSSSEHLFLILVIVATTWLVAALVDGMERTVLREMQNTGASRYRKAQTQLQIIHRIIMVCIWVLGFGLILMTFNSARTIGATLFTSAGLFSVVLGIAAQSTLGNVFAGLQLAFSDSIRMGDIVVWEEEFTTVEEITLTYVVLKVWDGRRLIVPSSLMTTKTFENWTRRTPDLLGYVDFDLDWSVPLPAMRAKLNEILAATDLWDGDTGILQVRDATGSKLQVSVLLSAENSSKLTDIKYYVREHLVRWIQDQAPQAIPHCRSLAAPDPDAEAIAEGAAQSDRVTDLEKARAGLSADPHEAAGTLDSETEEDSHPTDQGAGSLPDEAVVGGIIVPKAAVEDMTATVVMDLSELGIDGPERVPVSQRDVTAVLARDAIAGGGPKTGQTPGHESSIFTGSVQAEKRGRDFAGPGEDALRERESTLEKRKAQEADRARKAEAGTKSEASTKVEAGTKSEASTKSADTARLGGATAAPARGEKGDPLDPSRSTEEADGDGKD